MVYQCNNCEKVYENEKRLMSHMKRCVEDIQSNSVISTRSKYSTRTVGDTKLDKYKTELHSLKKSYDNICLEYKKICSDYEHTRTKLVSYKDKYDHVVKKLESYRNELDKLKTELSHKDTLIEEKLKHKDTEMNNIIQQLKQQVINNDSMNASKFEMGIQVYKNQNELFKKEIERLKIENTSAKQIEEKYQQLILQFNRQPVNNKLEKELEEKNEMIRQRDKAILAMGEELKRQKTMYEDRIKLMELENKK